MQIDNREFTFSTPYTVSIRDINYGGHVGNDVFLSYFQEGRIAYLKNLGFAELNIGGVGMILARIELDLKAELFHQDKISIYSRIAEIKNTSFIMEYAILKGDNTIAALGKTVMVAFDYTSRSIKRVPDIFREKVKEFEKL